MERKHRGGGPHGPAALLVLGMLLTLPALAGGSPRDSAVEYPKDAPRTWDRLFNDHDAADLAAQYSDSVTSMPFNAPTVHGRKAMETDFAKFFAENDGSRHETRVAELLMGTDWAVERAEYTLTYTPKATGKEIVETGRHVVCRKREAGQWRIAWELWNTTAP